MKILITGGSSYLGSRVIHDLNSKYDLVGTYHNNQLFPNLIQLNLMNKADVLKTIESQQPDIIFHTANHASGRIAKDNEENFTKLNLNATQYLVDAANSIGAKMIYISSFAALHPESNIYGKLKYESEEITKKANAGYLIIRPSLITGFSPNTTNDRPFNRILRCIDERSKAEFDSSWTFNPTYVGHVSQVTDYVIKKNKWNQLLHIAIDHETNQYQLAKDILNNFGIEVAPVDMGIDIKSEQVDLSPIDVMNLNPNTYQQMISIIVEEIRNRNSFKLD